MLDLRNLGKVTQPTSNDIERGAIRRFAEAIGDLNPLYLDAEHARAAGFSNVTAPPTFPLSLNCGAELKDLLGVPARSLVLADFTIEYERPLVAGDRILVSSRVANITERPGPAGKVSVAEVEDEGRDDLGKLVYRLRKTWVAR